MKIGSKIALFYTLISVLTTVIIIAVFYIFSTQYINKLYASYLREKAYLTAQKHWEKDEVDATRLSNANMTNSCPKPMRFF